jgi:hypothetical protein
MRKVVCGYAKDEKGILIPAGTMQVPFSKDKPTPMERRNKRRLARQGATVFKREIIR